MEESPVTTQSTGSLKRPSPVEQTSAEKGSSAKLSPGAASTGNATLAANAALTGRLVNYGLEKYDISGYNGLQDQDFFALNPNLRHILKTSLPPEDIEAIFEHLGRLGRLLGGEVNQLLFEAYRDEKLGRVERFDSTGDRIEAVRYCAELQRAKKLVFDAGVSNLDQHRQWGRPYHFLHKYAGLFMMCMNGEAGMNCGFGMTDGLLNLLLQRGSSKQKNRWLPRILSPDSDWHFTVGQFMTERVGGSNIGANRTVAYPLENGKWKLVGEKWLATNPGEIWVTTARLEGSKAIGLFLVPRIKDNGEINGHHILRIKDKLGARANLTVEIEYRDVEAEAIGNPRHGLGNLMHYMVNLTRLGMAVFGAALCRRSFLEARRYAHRRQAYGQNIFAFESVRRKLATLQVLSIANELAVFRALHLYEQKNCLSQFLVQWLKSKSTALSQYISHEAIILHGANGVIRDFCVLPRLYCDSLMTEFWEGAHNVIANHSIKYFFRPAVQRSFYEEVQSNFAIGREEADLSAALQFAEHLLRQIANIKRADITEANQYAFLEKVDALFSISLLLKEAALQKKRIHEKRDLREKNWEKNSSKRENLRKKEDHHQQENIYCNVLNAYADLLKHGRDGFLPSTSPLIDREISAAIIAF